MHVGDFRHAGQDTSWHGRSVLHNFQWHALIRAVAPAKTNLWNIVTFNVPTKCTRYLQQSSSGTRLDFLRGATSKARKRIANIRPGPRGLCYNMTCRYIPGKIRSVSRCAERYKHTAAPVQSKSSLQFEYTRYDIIPRYFVPNMSGDLSSRRKHTLSIKGLGPSVFMI